jgi:phosphohistidine phosphatase
MFTTNEEDQRKAANLQKRLEQQEATSDDCEVEDSGHRIPNVSIDSGTHKYVLISAVLPGGGERHHYVVSRRGAEYHQNVAEPFVTALERSGYTSIRITGGGRIALDEKIKTISIYGYSYGFGLADHALSKSVLEKDDRYQNYQISWSNDGY